MHLMGETFYCRLQNMSRNSQPWQVAGALTLGCFCGLMPKSNLLFPLALGLLSFLPIHFPIALLFLFASSCLSFSLYPVMGVLGGWILEISALRFMIHRLETLPVIAWFRLHNTVVMGWFGLSLAGSLPMFFLAHRRLLHLRLQWLQARIHETGTPRDSAEPETAIDAFDTKVFVFRSSQKVSVDLSSENDSLSQRDFMIANQQMLQIHLPESVVHPTSRSVVDAGEPVMNSSHAARQQAMDKKEVRRDEALKHLLKHLRNTSEKV